MSRERESETSFSSPTNHYGYRHAFVWRMRLARWRAVMSFTVVSTSFSSSSLKFDLRSQPAAVVLSPIDRRHDSGGTRPLRISSQMHIMLARNSSRFMCALDRSRSGIIHRQAKP